VIDDPTTRVEVMAGNSCLASWPLGQVRRDLTLVDAIARMHLGARRLGWTVRVRDIDAALRDLLELVGLTDVLTFESRR
jgi:hypothetical protein